MQPAWIPDTLQRPLMQGPIYLCMYIYICVHIYMCICTYTYIHTCIHTYTRIYAHCRELLPMFLIILNSTIAARNLVCMLSLVQPSSIVMVARMSHASYFWQLLYVYTYMQRYRGTYTPAYTYAHIYIYIYIHNIHIHLYMHIYTHLAKTA